MMFDSSGVGDLAEAVVAVAARVLGQVLLVVALRVVEGADGGDLGGDLAVAGVGQVGLLGIPGRFGSSQLIG